MKKDLLKWTVSTLCDRFREINFPEYQREPTVWNREKKQLLIDSMLRGFDIAPIYFFKSGESEIDCIDGRQRINAIMSFLGKNDEYATEDNGFSFHSTNEVFEEENPFSIIEGKCFEEPEFEAFRDAFNSYELNIVQVSEVDEPEELNLQFLRLQMGSILNSGEKLHAMTGDMRDFIFEHFGKHEFFRTINIPYRRYAREQVAAQIACHVFTLLNFSSFARTRYLDLQLFFKRYRTIESNDQQVTRNMITAATSILRSLDQNAGMLRNRALTVSFFLYARELIESGNETELHAFVIFFREFLTRLRWQIPKGFEMDEEYHDLIRFQTDLTQAVVEKPAVTRRHDFIHRYYTHYNDHSEIIGDSQYTQRTGNAPLSGSE
jgi:hypothetical protein